jgi:hypothetical protein
MEMAEQVQIFEKEFLGKKMKVKTIKVGEPTKLGNRSALFAIKDGRIENEKSFFISTEIGLLGTTILKAGTQLTQGEEVSVTVQKISSYTWEGVEKVIAYVLLD